MRTITVDPDGRFITLYRYNSKSSSGPRPLYYNQCGHFCLSSDVPFEKCCECADSTNRGRCEVCNEQTRTSQ